MMQWMWMVVAGQCAAAQPGPAVELAPETMASVNDDGGALRCEPSAGLSDELSVVAWNDSWGGRHGARTGVSIGWAVAGAADGGWAFRGYLPRPSARPAPGGADSRIAFDAAGRFYLLLLSWPEGAKRLHLYRGSAERPGDLQDVGVPFETEGAMIDKPDLDLSPDGGVFVAFRGEAGITVVRSLDGGATWSTPETISAPGDRVRSGVAIEADGDDVVAMWTERIGGSAEEIWAARSGDGGASFEPATRIDTLARPIAALDGYAMGVGPTEHMASDIGLAAHDGVFYAVYLEQLADGSRILLRESHDAGETWSAGRPVGAGGDSDKAFPSLEIVAGSPAVLYYDRRLDADDDTSTDVFLSWLEPSGEWLDTRITAMSTRWDQTPGDAEHAMIQRNFGDYISLAADGERFLAAWTDGRDGLPRIYTRRGRITMAP